MIDCLESAKKQIDNIMERDSLSIYIRDILANYQYVSPPSDSTIGVPWSADKVNAYVEKLRSALVEPYIQRFKLRETCEQLNQSQQTFADFWVIAQGEAGYVEWYDPATGEFGLGIQQGSELPISIGVRGDLIGVFCAM